MSFCIRTIRLPGEVNRPVYGGDTGVIATLASVHWSIIGVTEIAYQWVASRVADVQNYETREEWI